MTNKHLEELDALFADLDLGPAPEQVTTVAEGAGKLALEHTPLQPKPQTSYTTQLVNAAFGGLNLRLQ